jgi:flagella basal body P-ring formation protein FlgA
MIVTLCLCVVPVMADTGRTHDVGALIRQYVLDNTSASPDDVRIEFSSKLPEVTLNGEKISYEITRGGKDMLIGNCLFQVRFFDDGVQIGKYAVRANIEIQEKYLASTRVIKRNAIVGQNDLQVMHRWVRVPSLKAVSDVNDVVGKRLVVDLGPDQEIKRPMIKEPILVRKGEVVRIVLNHGQMSLLATGVAEEEGIDRQRIRVKNLASQKVILAKVMAEGLVRVELF